MPRCGTTAAWGCRGKAVRSACYQSQAATLRLLRPRKPLFLSSHQAKHLTRGFPACSTRRFEGSGSGCGF